MTEAIRLNRSKGDFLAIISRRCDADAMLAETFRRQFEKLSEKKFRLQPFELTTLPVDRFPTIEEMLNHTFFWRSDHSRFLEFKCIKIFILLFKLSVFYNNIFKIFTKNLEKIREKFIPSYRTELH